MKVIGKMFIYFYWIIIFYFRKYKSLHFLSFKIIYFNNLFLLLLLFFINIYYGTFPEFSRYLKYWTSKYECWNYICFVGWCIQICWLLQIFTKWRIIFVHLDPIFFGSFWPNFWSIFVYYVFATRYRITIDLMMQVNDGSSA
jgi:hypothetical protein